jgi:hypothetical protein
MSFPLPAVPPNTYHLPSTTCRRHPLRLPTSSYLAIARGLSHSSSDSRHALRQVRLYSCSKQCVWVWMNISASLGRREPSLWSAVWACRLGSAVSRRTSFPDIPTVLAPTSRNFSRIDVSRAETSACPSSLTPSPGLARAAPDSSFSLSTGVQLLRKVGTSSYVRCAPIPREAIETLAGYYT